MAKYDLKKLALLGLTSGLIISNPVSATSDQQVLSQLNNAGSDHTMARLIASPSTGENWNSSDQTQSQNRRNNGAGPRTTSGLRNDSGAKGPGGVRQQTASRESNDQTSTQQPQSQNNNTTRRDSQAQLSMGDDTTTNHGGHNNNNSSHNNSHANKTNTRGQLALGDSYDRLTDNAAKKNPTNTINPGPSTGTMNQSGRNQGVNTTTPTNQGVINQGGKTNSPTNQVPGKNDTKPSQYAYSGDAQRGNIAMEDDDNNERNDNSKHYDSSGNQGYGHPNGRRARHDCGAHTCKGQDNSVHQNSSKNRRTHNQNRTQQDQNQHNQMGGHKAGFSDQTQQQFRQRPGATGNQGVSAQRNNFRQQPQDDYQGW